MSAPPEKSRFTSLNTTGYLPVTTQDKYTSKFNAELLKKAAGFFTEAVQRFPLDTVNATGSDIRKHFVLKKGTIFKYPAKEPELEQFGPNYNFAERANVALLDELVKEEELTLGKEKEWVELRTSFEFLENPELLQLHALRRDDLGFGFDAERCLSVCRLSEWGANSDNFAEGYGDLSLQVFFVQRCVGSGLSKLTDSREEAVLRAQFAPKLKFSFGLKKLRAKTEEKEEEKQRKKKNPLEADEEMGEDEDEDENEEMEADDLLG
ncbi:hypothetical protein N0V90_003317 [Kalmusia sp. IMI 367209]|nr:hypothetical protein N0V90_003317 [Kalmusia sp. IMI 367209]